MGPFLFVVLLLKLKAQQLKCFGKYSFLLVTSCLLGHPLTYNRQLVTPFHSSTSFSKIPVVVELTFVIVLDKFMLSFIVEPIEIFCYLFESCFNGRSS